MKKYYFKTGGYDGSTCTEECNLRGGGIMIGSVMCQLCPNCEGKEEPCEYTGKVGWIKCSKLEGATNKHES